MPRIQSEQIYEQALQHIVGVLTALPVRLWL